LELPSRTLPPYRSTNSYLIAATEGAWLIDPGFEVEGALATVDRALAATDLGSLVAVLLTHSHRDHRAGVPALRVRHPELPLMAHPAALAKLADDGIAGDTVELREGATLALADGTLQVLATPGHSPDSLTYVHPDSGVALVGDLLAGTGSSWVGRPEGSVNAYLASLERLADLPLRRVGPGHGPPIGAPRSALLAARSHRLDRERQIVSALAAGSVTTTELRQAVYPEVDTALHDLVERSLLAHLDRLIDIGRVRQRPGADCDTAFERVA
jgi:glyoxylase-like metal-dependent hydrolase (beta-lactamase superfamily II)